METTDMREAGLSDPRAVLHGASHQERVDATLVQAVAQAWFAFDRATAPNGPLSDVPCGTRPGADSIWETDDDSAQLVTLLNTTG